MNKKKIAFISVAVIAGLTAGAISYPRITKADNGPTNVHITEPTATSTPEPAPDTATPTEAPDTTPSAGTTSVSSNVTSPTPATEPVAEPTPVHTQPVVGPAVTQSEIVDLLVASGAPGENRDAKIAACQNLYASRNRSDIQPIYNFHICSDQGLGDYSQY